MRLAMDIGRIQALGRRVTAVSWVMTIGFLLMAHPAHAALGEVEQQRDLVGEWTHPYSREAAAFPAAAQWQSKFWPAVNRVDNVYGDRNLFCACPPLESYQQDDE